MNTFSSCLSSCFANRETGREEEGGAHHRRDRLRRCRRFFTKLTKRGRRNKMNQELVEQSDANDTGHEVEPSIQEEIAEVNGTNPIDLEKTTSVNANHCSTNEEIEEEEEEEEGYAEFEPDTASYRERESSNTHLPTHHRIRISMKVKFMVFLCFFSMCYYYQQNVSVHEFVPPIEESTSLQTTIPNSYIAVNTRSSHDVISQASISNLASCEPSIENKWSCIKYIMMLLGLGGLYFVWDSIYGAFVLACCILSGFGVRDELRVSTWINWVNIRWRELEEEGERSASDIMNLLENLV